jgi:GPH family glycoside/pentoside/hexuronide:cation symporter
MSPSPTDHAGLSRRARLSFGLSGLAQNAIGTCLGVHLFVFYTDVVGLAPLWVSAGLFVATIWDAITDVWMGRVSDRTTWRAGRRRPYVLLGALPFGLAFVALLCPPRGLEGASLGVYFTVVLLVLFSASTVSIVPALSLLPEMAKGYDERTKLAASREMLGNVGDLLGLMLPLGMMIVLGFRGGEGQGDRDIARDAFGYAAVVGGAIVILALFFTWRGTFEDPRARPSESSFGGALKALAKNRSFRVLLGASCLAALGLAFVQALILYVIEHVMGETDPAIHMSAFAVNAIAAIGSYPLWTRLARAKGKPAAFRAGLVLSSITFASVFFIGPGMRAALYVVMAFAGAANVGFWMLMHALSADVVDLDELAHGERREGLFAGFAALLRKCAFAAAAAGVGIGLTVIGYHENAAQSAQTIFGLKLLFAGPPTVLLLGALAVFSRFTLTREAHAGVVAELADRAVSRPLPQDPEAEMGSAPAALEPA